MPIKIQVECTGITVPGAGGPTVNPPQPGASTDNKLNVSFASVQDDPVQTGVITLLVAADTALTYQPGKTYSLTIE